MERKFEIFAVVIILLLIVLALSIGYTQKTNLSPKDRIKSGDYYATDSQLILNAECLRTSIMGDTGSMRPAIHTNHTVIYTMCFDKDDLQVGVFIIFDSERNNKILPYRIVHQIIQIKEDGYITQGLNNPIPDAGLVRFSQIEGVVIGILY